MFQTSSSAIVSVAFKNLSFSKNCQDDCEVSCFKIIDNSSSFYQLKIKESFHIERLKPYAAQARVTTDSR